MKYDLNGIKNANTMFYGWHLADWCLIQGLRNERSQYCMFDTCTKIQIGPAQEFSKCNAPTPINQLKWQPQDNGNWNNEPKKSASHKQKAKARYYRQSLFAHRCILAQA